MIQINKIEFRSVIIDGMETELNILTYSKENFSMFFSLQSVAQCINEMMDTFGAGEIFHHDFFVKWRDLKLKCITEFQLQLMIPLNLIMEPSTELYNPMPSSLMRIRYLNDRYYDTISQFSDPTNNSNDPFCIAEKQNFTTTSNGTGISSSLSSEFHHKFVNSIGFLSLISVLKIRYLRKLYKTFFLMELMNVDDIEYIYDTLVANRKRLQSDDISNVFSLDPAEIVFVPIDLSEDGKQQYTMLFNRSCKLFKSYAFNIMDEQSTYISKNLQIINQFGMDRKAIDTTFNQIPKINFKNYNNGNKSKLSEEQYNLLCRRPSSTKLSDLNDIELNILHSIIKIHLMIQRMTNVSIHKDDLTFYRQILKSRFSVDIDDLINDCDDTTNCMIDNNDDDDISATMSYETLNGKHTIVKNYTIGEIIGEFLQLYLYAQQNINTIWLCKFIRMSCNPRYSNLVNIMADFVPYFQRFFTNDFNINSINNLIMFLQGMCRPDEQKIKSLRDFKNIKHLDVRNFKSFSLTRYKSYNSNPLVTFIDLILTTRVNQQSQFLVNMNALGEIDRFNLLSLNDPNEKLFIDYIYELMATQTQSQQYHSGVNDEDNDFNINMDPNSEGFDLSGDIRFNLHDIDYDNIVPVVSTNTFNENNISKANMQLYNGIINQSIFFHELTNRIIYKIPGVVCNIVLK